MTLKNLQERGGLPTHMTVCRRSWKRSPCRPATSRNTRRVPLQHRLGRIVSATLDSSCLTPVGFPVGRRGGRPDGQLDSAGDDVIVVTEGGRDSTSTGSGGGSDSGAIVDEPRMRTSKMSACGARGGGGDRPDVSEHAAGVPLATQQCRRFGEFVSTIASRRRRPGEARCEQRRQTECPPGSYVTK